MSVNLRRTATLINVLSTKDQREEPDGIYRDPPFTISREGGAPEKGIRSPYCGYFSPSDWRALFFSSMQCEWYVRRLHASGSLKVFAHSYLSQKSSCLIWWNGHFGGLQLSTGHVVESARSLEQSFRNEGVDMFISSAGFLYIHEILEKLIRVFNRNCLQCVYLIILLDFLVTAKKSAPRRWSHAEHKNPVSSNYKPSF